MSDDISASHSSEQATFAKVRSATTPAQVVSAFHMFQKHCEQKAAQIKSNVDPVGFVLRTAAIATSLLRHARIASSQTTKPLEIRPDVLARMVVLDIVRLYESCELPAEHKWEHLRLLKAEAQLIRLQFRHHAVTQLRRMTESSAWDVPLIAQSIHDLPPPFDLTNLARYVKYVEDDGESRDDQLPVVEDVSLKTSVSAKDPNSLCRIELPCRGSKCHHLQCFDLVCFLAVLQRAAKTASVDDRNCRGVVAPCPVCSTKLAITELYIDKHQEAALSTSPHVASLSIDRQTGLITTVLGAIDVSDVGDEVDVERTSKRLRDDSDFTVEGVALHD
ncbi:zinc finger protein, putative [Bodo saltans]|uniref:Zinc finger protein, putative n=1 Tax=Bodo saltans TaxID=75058 RepID=A0A0S4IKH9_BODSA|nr:zinc finger protein, putative [Bodo saltans]|eukprot:CUF08309.1 zinc finger protein, putative [Bodo saltans]